MALVAGEVSALKRMLRDSKSHVRTFDGIVYRSQEESMRQNTSSIHRGMAALVAIFVLACGAAVGRAAEPEAAKPDFSKLKAYDVVKVEDGATVVVRMADKNVTVRLIGVDIGEAAGSSKAAGAKETEGTRFLMNLLAGESVCIAQDNAGDKTDKQGRMLVYLFRAPDGLFVNLEVIRQGYARADANSKSAYMGQFRDAEQFARGAGKGVWAAEAKKGTGDGTGEAQGHVLVMADGKEQAVRFVEIKDGKLFYAVTVVVGSASGEVTRSVPIEQVKELRRAAPKSASAAPAGPEGTPGKPTTPRAAGPGPAADGQQGAPGTTTIFVTPGGDAYHRPTCRFVQKDKVAMSLKQAIQLGYAPCKVCRPPEQ